VRRKVSCSRPFSAGALSRGFPLLLALAATGCFGASGASLEQLRARATFDLQCPSPETQLLDIDVRTKGVRGCGKQLTYVEVCDNRPDGWHCTWVLNAPAWYIAPPRVTPRPEGTWWWTQPQGVEASPPPATPSVPPVQAPPVFSPPPTALPVAPWPPASVTSAPPTQGPAVSPTTNLPTLPGAPPPPVPLERQPKGRAPGEREF
jgi:hypothetical protein